MTKRHDAKTEKFIIMQRLKSFTRQTFDKLYFKINNDLFVDCRRKIVYEYVNRNTEKYFLKTKKYMYICCQGIYTLLENEQISSHIPVDLLDRADCSVGE